VFWGIGVQNRPPAPENTAKCSNSIAFSWPCSRFGFFRVSFGWVLPPVYKFGLAETKVCSRLRFLDYRADIPLPLNLLNPPTANVAYRRQIFDQIGYFDARLTSGGDLDFAWRVQMRTERQIKLVPEAIIYHRHRRDLPSMARQYRKNGWGYGLQALHQASEYGSDPYRIARQMQIESLILISLSIPRHFLDFSSRLLRALFHRPIDPLYVKTPVYTLVGTVNFYCGRLTAARNGNKALFQESPYGLPARPPGKPP
jgi:hypothetical protein